jgi:hypothetical protein
VNAGRQEETLDVTRRRYRVLVYGRNFRLAFEERRRTVVKQTGFYTWRNVMASDARAAEYEAIDLIRNDARLRTSVRNNRHDPPIMQAIEIEPVPRGSAFSKAGTGYTFFHGRGAGRPRTLTLAAKGRTP